jgi:hypothetical protein
MTVSVTELKHLGGWRFRVTFSEGSTAVWDYSRVKDRKGPMAEPLKDEAYVARAFIDMGAPTWPNGWDVSPDALYAELKAAGALTPARAAE